MEEELEILQSIYPNDIVKTDLKSEPACIEVLVYPTFTENEENKKNIILTLVIKLSKNYPSVTPVFEFKNVKGVLDLDLDKISSKINEIANKNIGEHMLFEIIQEIKDFLSTYQNVPKSCKCSICLNQFEKKDNIAHLNCYHYYHTHCLQTFLNFTKKDIEKEKKEAEFHKIKWIYRTVSCPECRQEITGEQIKELEQFPGCQNQNKETNEKIVLSSKMLKLQQNMKILYEKQRKKGGIIEPNDEIIISLNGSSEV